MALSRIALIVVYFGRPPEYFPLFLQTARCNPTIDFKIFGDIDSKGQSVPENVAFVPATLASVGERARQVLGFQPALPRPYKLCDFKGLYGKIFEPELRGYDYWGHFDLDVLLGDLRAYLTEDRLASHARTFAAGHLSVYRNSPEITDSFRLTMPGWDYREVLADPRNWAFDEWPLTLIYGHHGIPFFHDAALIADPPPLKSDLRILGENVPQLFVWQRGHIYNLYVSAGKVEQKEFMHLHLQKRKMQMAGRLEEFLAADRWYIGGDKILPGRDEPLTPADLWRMNPPHPLRDLRKQMMRPMGKLRRHFNNWKLRRSYRAAKNAQPSTARP